MFPTENVKKVGHDISEFFHYNVISFNAADSDFYHQAMINIIDLMLEYIGSMKSVNETLNDAKMITSFIYNSLKVVYLMK